MPINVYQTRLRNPSSGARSMLCFPTTEDVLRVLTNRDPDLYYWRVATVEGEDLDLAFELTNTIDGPWWHNKGVKPTMQAAEGCRSTSVGDVMCDGHSRWWMVASMGFEQLPYGDNQE